MSQTLSKLFKQCNHLKAPYSILFWVCISALACLQLSQSLYSYQQQQWVSDSANNYGESLAKLSAAQVVNSLLTQDAISLQAIAQTISEQSIAHTVIIYDINHAIVAQASRLQDPSLPSHHHTAPVVSNSNIIGSVTVGLSDHSMGGNPDNTGLLAISGLLIVLAVIFYSKGKAGQATSTSANTKTTPLVTDEAPSDAADEPETSIEHLLSIKIHNTDQLYQQLNADLRAKQFSLLEAMIARTAQLYSGKLCYTSDNGITLSFSGDNDICNTVFTGQLILRLNQEASQSIIQLSALVHSKADDESLQSSLDTVRKCFNTEHKGKLFVSRHFVEQGVLDNTINTTANTNARAYQVDSFKDNYQALLDKQLAQLR